MDDTPPRQPGLLEQLITLKHSGLGIASLILAVIMGVAEFIIIALCGYLEVSTPGGMNENSPVAMAVGLSLFGGLFGCMAGVGLSIGALFQRDRQKLFAILGLTFNLLIILGVIGVIIFGIAVG